jgi:hypothetical protein
MKAGSNPAPSNAGFKHEGSAAQTPRAHCQSNSKWTFGPLAISANSPGLIYLSDATKERIRAMPLDDVRAANRAAWKLRRTAERLMERYSNVTVHGCASHDSASRDYFLAKEVCSATWAVMRGAS